jgi:hypothetical protein
MNTALLNSIVVSQNDPGAITPRGDNFNEPLEKWKKRALDIVLERAEVKIAPTEEENVQNIQDICDICCDAEDAPKVNWQHIGLVFQWLINNDYAIYKKP